MKKNLHSVSGGRYAVSIEGIRRIGCQYCIGPIRRIFRRNTPYRHTESRYAVLTERNQYGIFGGAIRCIDHLKHRQSTKHAENN